MTKISCFLKQVNITDEGFFLGILWIFLDSSMGVGFLNLTSQLRQANITTLCMQLRNSEDR